MKAHILIVDDDPRITDLLRRILAYEGYSVTTAATGQEALNRVLERPPDLIILDIMLPGLNGLEVAKPVCPRRTGGAREGSAAPQPGGGTRSPALR